MAPDPRYYLAGLSHPAFDWFETFPEKPGRFFHHWDGKREAPTVP